MDKIRILYIATFGAFLSIAAMSVQAQDSGASNVDNTEVNVRDRNAGEPTADQAKNNLSDRKIMQKIRKAVVKDKSLSTYAHNVKIISEHGKVTLKGPVHSEDESTSIETKALKVAGQGNVDNQLSVKSDSKYR
jgi:hyperosmotically inducible protein